MLPYILVVIYLICVLGVAWLGRNTIAGAFGTGVFALLLTPAVALIALLIFVRRSETRIIIPPPAAP